jgi:hypothetical protein
MKLTKKEAIKRHRELWGWLAENPMKEKRDWPGWGEYEDINGGCFLCEYAFESQKNDSNGLSICDYCPVEFKETNGYLRGTVGYCLGGLFSRWDRAIEPKERSRIASLIRDLPEKVESKPEPKFKVGDKVVPIGISWENWTLEKYLNFPGRIPAFLREKGYLRVSKINNDKYYCGTDSLQGLDGFFESELIPYIETPKYHAPQNYSCCEIVVNQYDRKTIYNGPATICIINLGGKDYKGIAKCAPDDVFNERFGQGLAETRALIKAYRDIERRLIAKASQREG